MALCSCGCRRAIHASPVIWQAPNGALYADPCGLGIDGSDLVI